MNLGVLTYQRSLGQAVAEFEEDASTIPTTHMILMMVTMAPIPVQESGLTQG